MATNLKPGVSEDLRSLAIEIVDALRGHTLEHSNQPGVHQLDYDAVERILIERIGARMKGRPRSEVELAPEELERFRQLVIWANERAMVRLRSGTVAMLMNVTPTKAKVRYNGGHHTVPIEVVVERVERVGL